jgi:hypothetical protein
MTFEAMIFSPDGSKIETIQFLACPGIVIRDKLELPTCPDCLLVHFSCSRLDMREYCLAKDEIVGVIIIFKS